MKRLATLALALGLAGCADVASKRDEPVEVTATVTGPDGKPLSKALVVVLQPTGDYLPARLEAKADGKFTGKAMPGTYIYYVKHPRTDVPPKGFPAKFTEPNAENKVDVSAGTDLTIKVG